jgi:hypothetical protein
VVGVLGAVLVACGTQKDFDTYQQAITEFQTATNATSNAAASYILSANTFVRTIEFKRLEADPARELNLGKLVEGPYNPAAVQARQQAFNTLNTYTNLLAKIANSDAPSRWETAATKLGANTKAFAQSLDKNADAGLSGSPLLALLGEDGPLSQLAAFAGTEFINMKRAQALDDAITDAKPAIDAVSAALRRDFQRALELRKVDITDGLLDAGVTYRQAQEVALADPHKEPARLRALAALKTAIKT